MLDNLQLRHLPAEIKIPADQFDQSFVMQTCQRTLFLDINQMPARSIENSNSEEDFYLRGLDAYHFLLEVICGIQSKVLAESEIVSQFKEAYLEYLKKENRDSKIIRILEKLLKDAKQIRSEYLSGVGQKTYAAITRKIIGEVETPKRLLIIGTGNLSVDVINQMKKRVDSIYLSARNYNKVQELCQQHILQPLEWRDFDMYKEFSHIVNTVGTDDLTLFDHNFFVEWKEIQKENSIFIDLGSPSIVDTEFSSSQGVIRLEDIFQKSIIKEKEKLEKIEKAQEAIKDVTQKRHINLLNASKRVMT